MKNTIKYISLFCALLLLGVSCNDSKKGSEPEPNPVIQLNSSMTSWHNETPDGETKSVSSAELHSITALPYMRAIPVETRASVPSNVLHPGQQAGVYIVDNAGVVTYPVNLSFLSDRSGRLVHARIYEYPLDEGAEVKISAYYPYYEGTTDSYEFSVAADQTLDADYCTSDLMFSTEKNYSSSTSAHSVAFTHLLTKVKIELVQGPDVTAEEFEGATVELVGLQDKVNFNRLTGAITPITTSTTDIVPHAILGAVVPPQTVAADMAFIKVTLIGGNTLYYVPDAPIVLNASTEYAYTVTVRRHRLEVAESGGITDWDASGEVKEDEGTPQVTAPVDPALILYSFSYSGINPNIYAPLYYDGQLYLSPWATSYVPNNTPGTVYPLAGVGSSWVWNPGNELVIQNVPENETPALSHMNPMSWTTDGTYYYFAYRNMTIYKIDMATPELIETMPVSYGGFTYALIDVIAYDPDHDAFWAEGLGTTQVHLINRDGTYAGKTLYGPAEGVMGLAYDDISPGGPYLWLSYGVTSTNNFAKLGRWHIASGTFTPNIVDLKGLPGASTLANSGGSLYIYQDDVTGKYVLAGILQGSSLVFGLDLLEL